ncbi:hypothetical protein IOD14_01425 [Streptomyces sp. A2-16]|uniref:hypothetical protein n=1 Tax=Streptomyces sp. A2-16 TaxID=2781734 RepID=UPI001BAFFA7C|nr:hypothetical protein [Streptomyces sp. A2-16]QUC63781.1 hypothetical protein IOD14_01425 [Streptomyces sp. A2-16]
MKLDREWWRTVRYAIEEEHRTVRLIGVLVTVGAIMAVLIIISNGFSVTIG